MHRFLFVALLVLTGCVNAIESGGSGALPLQPAFGSPAASGYRVLYRFRGGADDGSLPFAGLMSISGVLYGTTTVGGGHGRRCFTGSCGTVFAIDTSGRHERLIYRFKGGMDGAYPYSRLIYHDGLLYGTTTQGGVGNCVIGIRTCGTVFSLTTVGQERVLYRFPGGNGGGIPNAGVTWISGVLYGTTLFGGQGTPCAHECGTVFAVAPKSGTGRVLHHFKGGRDGFLPSGALLAASGALFGTAQSGGQGWPGGLGCCGIVFSIATSGVERVLYPFTNDMSGSGGGAPSGSLIEVRGVLYGTTSGGGSIGCGCGVVFAVTQTGAERLIYRFLGGVGGGFPQGALIWDGSRFYGTTEYGGMVTKSCTQGCGTVFSLTRSGKYEVLHRFRSGTDGSIPANDLFLLNGTLYGVTEFGGGQSCGDGGNPPGCGTVFALRLPKS